MASSPSVGGGRARKASEAFDSDSSLSPTPSSTSDKAPFTHTTSPTQGRSLRPRPLKIQKRSNRTADVADLEGEAEDIPERVLRAPSGGWGSEPDVRVVLSEEE